ncbi:MAG: DUF2490 domain-containing protein [Bacteroidetes bacterium]|nr:DUF2490 domain-containing protein [Bacteroidota bacterium]
MAMMTSPCWMMVTMIKWFLKISAVLWLLALAAGGSLYGQQKDFQTWFEAEVEKGLDNGIDLSGEFEQRFRNNSTQYDRTLLTVAASYDPLDYLSAGGGVRMLLVSDPELTIRPRYRFHANATGKYSLYDVDFSLRVRFQYGFEEFTYFSNIRDNTFVNRNRVKAAYHLFGTRFDLFATIETWGVFGSLDGRFFKRMRYSAGTSYTLNFRSELSLRYILEDEFNQINPATTGIFVFGYSHNL